MSALGKKKSDRFSQPTSTTANISTIVDQSREQAVGVELIPVSRIIRDPKNPRKIPVSWEDPTQFDESDPEAAFFFEELQGLAATIKANNNTLINPIQVYRHGNDYCLVSGQRRVLAHKLNQRESILASIHQNPRVRLSQFVENMQRSDISLAEKVVSLNNLIDEAKQLGEITSPKDVVPYLMEKGGIVRTNAYHWGNILAGPESVRQAINDGLVTSIKQAAMLSAMEDDVLATALADLANAPAQDDNKGLPTPPVGGTPVPRTRGRPKTAVKLPKVKNPAVLRYVVQQVMGDDAPDIDWNDLDAVAKAFKAMIESVETKIQ